MGHRKGEETLDEGDSCENRRERADERDTTGDSARTGC